MPLFPELEIAPEKLGVLHELDARLAEIKGRPGENIGIVVSAEGVEILASDVTKKDLTNALADWKSSVPDHPLRARVGELSELEDAMSSLRGDIDLLLDGDVKRAMLRMQTLLVSMATMVRGLAEDLHEPTTTPLRWR